MPKCKILFKIYDESALILTKRLHIHIYTDFYSSLHISLVDLSSTYTYKEQIFLFLSCKVLYKNDIFYVTEYQKCKILFKIYDRNKTTPYTHIF